MNSLRVLTYNIHKGFNLTNRRFVLERIREAVAAVEPDVVFLQEVQGEDKRKEGRIEGWWSGPQSEYLAENLWPHVVYGRTAVRAHGHHGNAILSRYPIEDWTNTDISTNKLESRGILHAKIRTPGSDRPFHCMCVHLDLLKRGRAVQLQRICDEIHRAVPEGEPLILAGDFNDWTRAASRVLEVRAGLTEAFKTLIGKYATTFPSRLPVLNLDRIYSRNLEPIGARLLSGPPWSTLSDHNALWAEYRINR